MPTFQFSNVFLAISGNISATCRPNVVRKISYESLEYKEFKNVWLGFVTKLLHNFFSGFWCFYAHFSIFHFFLAISGNISATCRPNVVRKKSFESLEYKEFKNVWFGFVTKLLHNFFSGFLCFYAHFSIFHFFWLYLAISRQPVVQMWSENFHSKA